MSYQALYRTYRPGRFADLVGQEHVVRTLLHALEQKKVSHAYLFAGVRGTGKTSSAKILAKALNCLEPVGGEPCNHCASCLKINEGSFMDILEIDAASNRGIDEIRDLREKIRFLPVEGKVKVYIIDEVHMLTTEAFNALLKTLEEPPEHVVFILATTESHKIPLTILSRCQKFDFHKIPMEQLKERLEKIALENGGKVTEEALTLMAKLAGGGLRDGISLLDQCLTSFEGEITAEMVGQIAGIPDRAQLLGLLEAMGRKDGDKVLALYEVLKEQGKSIGQLLGDLTEALKNLLVTRSLKRPEAFILDTPQDIQALVQAGAALKKEEILAWLWRLGEVEKLQKNSSHPDILLEVELLRGLEAPYPAPAERGTAAPGPGEKAIQPAGKKMPAASPPKVPEKPEDSGQAGDMPPMPGAGALWGAFMEALEARNKSLHAYLKEGEGTEVEGNAFRVRFSSKYAFHKERAELPNNLKEAEEVLRQVAGRKLRLEIRGEAEAEPEKERPGDLVRSLFGAEAVTIVDDKEDEE